MSKKCPECGKNLPDEANFCFDCGYDFSKTDSKSLLPDPKIFLVIIAVVLIIGIAFIATSGNTTPQNVTETPEDIFDISISEVGGYDNGNANKRSYTLYTEAIFSKTPDNLDGYKIKTTYYDDSDKEIGHEIESLKSLYADSEYGTYFGYYTSYKMPHPKYVTVDIINASKNVYSIQEEIDTNKIDFLN